MAPVIKAHLGGLFCGRWTPEGGGVVHQRHSEGFYAQPSLRACHQLLGRKFQRGTLAIFADAKMLGAGSAWSRLRYSAF